MNRLTDTHLHMQGERKPVSKSFLAKFPGTCATCHLPVEVGQRARYNPDGLLVHHRHTHIEETAKVCPSCWLVMPCDCE